ncbi:hypothetical protein D047_2316A, partial [Vibrio parahaemolyticus VPTS-2010_2]
MAYYHSLAN